MDILNRISSERYLKNDINYQSSVIRCENVSLNIGNIDIIYKGKCEITYNFITKKVTYYSKDTITFIRFNKTDLLDLLEVLEQLDEFAKPYIKKYYELKERND